MLIYPAVSWIVGNLPASRANNFYSPGRDELTEVQRYMSTCQFHVNQAAGYSELSLTLKTFFLFSDLAGQIRNQTSLFNIREGSDKQPGN